jgi:hypothetical protein
MDRSIASPSPSRKSRSRSNSSPARVVEELAEELLLARRLDRPSILLVIAAEEGLRRRAARELAARLRAEGLTVQSITAARVPEQDIPRAIRSRTRRATQVFFVHDLSGGGANGLRALNMRREYFTSSRARVVFWLTPHEEQALTRRATDFWAIRHRAVHLNQE